MLESLAPVLILLTLAALISDLAGTLNIGIEGIVYLGSFLISLLIVPQIGLIGAFFILIVFGFLFGWFMGILHTRFHANVFILGLGINLLALALVPILSQLLFKQKGGISWNIPDEHLLGALTWFIVLLVLAIIFVWYTWTLIGIRFRSLANHAEMLYARGVQVNLYKTWALAISGGLAALAGAFYSLHFSAFSLDSTSGLGWIALILLYVGAKHPLGILLAVLAFVGLKQVSLGIQSDMQNPEFAEVLPYFGLLVLLVIVQLSTRKRLEL